MKILCYTLADENSFGEREPLSLVKDNNLNEPATPSVEMFVESTEETNSSQLQKSNYSLQKECHSSISISRTPISRKSMKLSSNVNQISPTCQFDCNNPREEEVMAERESNFNRLQSTYKDLKKNILFRTPSVVRKTPALYSEPRNQLIVPSIEKSSPVTRTDTSYNCRTSTPTSSSRHDQLNRTPGFSYNESFSIDSISPETYDILSKFAEFRKLMKAYKAEVQKSQTWINDYSRLKRKYELLEANSFRKLILFIRTYLICSFVARPSAASLDYLVELVTKIQQSGGQSDPRTDQQLADDLGLSLLLLSSFKESSPQQAALNVFNHIYPGYRSKVELGSAINMDQSNPGQLNSILGKYIYLTKKRIYFKFSLCATFCTWCEIYTSIIKRCH